MLGREKFCRLVVLLAFECEVTEASDRGGAPGESAFAFCDDADDDDCWFACTGREAESSDEEKSTMREEEAEVSAAEKLPGA